jgi:hypothetical protein
LCNGSIAIDAGTVFDMCDTLDIVGNPRKIGKTIDIGACEYQGIIIAKFQAQKREKTFYCSIYRRNLSITMSEVPTTGLLLEIVNVAGKRLWKRYISQSQAPDGKYEVQLPELNSNVLFVRVVNC